MSKLKFDQQTRHFSTWIQEIRSNNSISNLKMYVLFWISCKAYTNLKVQNDFKSVSWFL